MEGQQVQLDFSKAQPIGQQQAPQPQGGGVQLDFSKAQPTVPKPNALQVGIPGVFNGIGEGVYSTAAGASDIIDKVAGMHPGVVNAKLHELAGDNEKNTTPEQDLGQGAEAVAEFLMGDEALKALPVSQRLAKISGIAKSLEESPVLNRIFQAGVRAVRGGTVGGVEAGTKSGGDLGTAAAGAAGGAVGSAVIPEVAAGVQAGAKALPGLISKTMDAAKGSDRVVQPAVQNAIKGVLNDVAHEYNVRVPQGTMLRDHPTLIGNELRDTGRAIYQELDSATGTKFQSYQDAIDKARDAFENEPDPAKKMKLGTQLQRAEDVQEAAHNEALKQGIDPEMLKLADQYYRQGSALQDLGNKLRMSTSGFPPSTPEKVNAGQLARAIQRLRDSGRLQQALGSQERADDLVKALEEGHVKTQEVNANRKTLGTAVKFAAGGGIAGEAARRVFGK